jgi:hypothetical protein
MSGEVWMAVHKTQGPMSKKYQGCCQHSISAYLQRSLIKPTKWLKEKPPEAEKKLGAKQKGDHDGKMKKRHVLKIKYLKSGRMSRGQHKRSPWQRGKPGACPKGRANLLGVQVKHSRPGLVCQAIIVNYI